MISILPFLLATIGFNYFCTIRWYAFCFFCSVFALHCIGRTYAMHINTSWFWIKRLLVPVALDDSSWLSTHNIDALRTIIHVLEACWILPVRLVLAIVQAWNLAVRKVSLCVCTMQQLLRRLQSQSHRIQRPRHQDGKGKKCKRNQIRRVEMFHLHFVHVDHIEPTRNS